MSAPFRQEYLSVSRLKLYERCALAFKYGYVDKGPKEPFGIAGMFGTVLHRALELAYQWILEEEYAGLFPTDILIQSYKKAWIENPDLGGGNVTLFQEGLEILRAYADRNATVDHMRVIAVEQEFRIAIGPFTLLGYIDHVEKMGDDGVQILDFKSNRSLFSKDELESDLQASAYLVAAKYLYPWATKFRFAFDMLRHRTRQGVERTRQNLNDAEEYLITLGHKTETDTEWKPRLNELCGWCDHRGRCGEYKAAVAGGRDTAKIASLEGVEEIAAERELVARTAKMAYARKEALDKLLKAKLAQDGEFTAAGVHYRMVNNFDTSYLDAERVIRAFVAYGKMDPDEARKKIVGVDASAVKALQAEVSKTLDRSRAAVLEATLAAIATKTPQSPRIDARAEKKGVKAQRADDAAKESSLAASMGRIANIDLSDEGWME